MSLDNRNIVEIFLLNLKKCREKIVKLTHWDKSLKKIGILFILDLLMILKLKEIAVYVDFIFKESTWLLTRNARVNTWAISKKGKVGWFPLGVWYELWVAPTREKLPVDGSPIEAEAYESLLILLTIIFCLLPPRFDLLCPVILADTSHRRRSKGTNAQW